MTERQKSIDFIRGVAIVLMIQTHVWEYYITRPTELGSYLHRGLVGPLGSYAAPLFTLVSGQSAYFATRACGGQKPWDCVARLLRRGGALFLLSTAVNIASGPILKVIDISILNWSVIQLIGFCLCLAPTYARLRWPFRLLWAAIPLMLSEWLHASSGPFSVFFAGFSPPCPWSFLFFAGMLVGDFHAFLSRTAFSSRTRAMVFAGVLSIGLVGCGFVIAHQPLTWNHTAHASITSMVTFVGCFIVLVQVLGYIIDYRRFEHRLVDIIVGWGRHSLTVYYLQLVGIVASAILIRSTLHYPPALDPIWFLPLLTFVLLVLHIIINVIWPKYNYALSLEWFLARLVNGKHSMGRI